jgi:HD-like signal output (HDOD) protein
MISINNEKKLAAEKLLSGIKNLPSIPKIMFDVTRLLNNPRTTTSELVQLIGKDQGLTTKILSIANSPLYGLQRKVSSLEFALIVLGFKEIGDIVIAISMADAVKMKAEDKFNFMDFWTHSMIVGAGAKGLAQTLGLYDLASDAFVAGTLHDLGSQLIFRYFSKEYDNLLQAQIDGLEDHLNLEYSLIGMSHQEIGRFLAEKWNLPKELCEVMQFHHTPSKAVINPPLVSLVHVADYITQKLQIASFSWDNNFILDEAVIEILNLISREKLEEGIEEYRELYAMSAAGISI